MPKYLIIIFLFTISIFPQNISIGGSLGGGIIGGNSPNQSAAFASVYIESSIYDNYLSNRIKFIYGTDINAILPESQSIRYYSFIKAFSYLTVMTQKIAPRFFIEESLGVLFINDRTFSDVNDWDYGVCGGFSAGYMLSDSDLGWRFGLGLEFGFSTYSSTVRYYTFQLEGKYIF